MFAIKAHNENVERFISNIHIQWTDKNIKWMNKSGNHWRYVVSSENFNMSSPKFYNSVLSC